MSFVMQLKEHGNDNAEINLVVSLSISFSGYNFNFSENHTEKSCWNMCMNDGLCQKQFNKRDSVVSMYTLSPASSSILWLNFNANKITTILFNKCKYMHTLTSYNQKWKNQEQLPNFKMIHRNEIIIAFALLKDACCFDMWSKLKYKI